MHIGTFTSEKLDSIVSIVRTVTRSNQPISDDTNDGFDNDALVVESIDGLKEIIDQFLLLDFAGKYKFIGYDQQSLQYPMVQPIFGSMSVAPHTDNVFADGAVMFVLQGSDDIEFQYSYWRGQPESRQLKAGDILVFDPSLTHSLLNSCKQDWTILIVDVLF